jgi:hypothetical protein
MNETLQQQVVGTSEQLAGDVEEDSIQRPADVSPHPLLGRVFTTMGCIWFFIVWNLLLLGLAIVLNVCAQMYAWSASLVLVLNLLIIIQAMSSGPVLLVLRRWTLRAEPSQVRIVCPLGATYPEPAALAECSKCPALRKAAKRPRQGSIPPEAVAAAKLDRAFSEILQDEHEHGL